RRSAGESVFMRPCSGRKGLRVPPGQPLLPFYPLPPLNCRVARVFEGHPTPVGKEVRAVYQRSERPLTDVERETLHGRLKGAKERVTGGICAVVALVLFDGLVVFAGVMIALGKSRDNARTTILGAVVAAVANLVLLAGIAAIRGGRRERRRVQEALADGKAAGEHAEAGSGASAARAGGWGRGVVVVRGGRLPGVRPPHGL